MDKEAIRRELGDLPTPHWGWTGVLRNWLARREPGVIAGYLAFGHEPDVGVLIGSLPRWEWVLPRVEPDGALTFRPALVPRERHRWGMMQPADRGIVTPVEELDVVLVPGVGFTATGHRLGRGGGFYDRVLSTRRSESTAVGVVAANRVLASVPIDDHDERVDWIATERGMIQCSGD